MAKYYRIDSTVPAYANRFGLTGRDKYVYANSPSEARRTALALIGPNLPAAALLVEEVPVITGSTAIEKGTAFGSRTVTIAVFTLVATGH